MNWPPTEMELWTWYMTQLKQTSTPKINLLDPIPLAELAKIPTKKCTCSARLSNKVKVGQVSIDKVAHDSWCSWSKR